MTALRTIEDLARLKHPIASRRRTVRPQVRLTGPKHRQRLVTGLPVALTLPLLNANISRFPTRSVKRRRRLAHGGTEPKSVGTLANARTRPSSNGSRFAIKATIAPQSSSAPIAPPALT
ncbi:MAG: hypothetical protein EOO77_08940 [Oxalobacteraceae bacterium]|nr:MAG: hypothetical protein EOO77_08940 [Oxalobacteraceae bacterium]